ncbi:MAG: glycine cleavage system aminomethyltransferase GcvT [Pseudomonadota bacterium]
MSRSTALAEEHALGGARMVDFAGWQLPVQYASAQQEHDAVRQAAGMFDVSHMMITDVQGPGAQDFLRTLLCADVARLGQPGAGRYTCLLNEAGGVIDDLIVFRRAFGNAPAYRIVSNAGTRERVNDWFAGRLSGWSGPEVKLHSRSDLSMLAIQGPEALGRSTPHLLAIALGSESDAATLEGLERFYAVEGEQGFVSRTGYTGEVGVEVCLPHAQAVTLWRQLRDEAQVVPCGLAARDVLRLEAGLNLQGTDMDESTRPQEVGLRWLLDLEDAKRDFVGRSAVDPVSAAPERFVRQGLRLEDKGVPRGGCEVLAGEHVEQAVRVGEVTSGSFSSTLGCGIALFRLDQAHRAEVRGGVPLYVQVRQRRLRAALTPPPFVRPEVP